VTGMAVTGRPHGLYRAMYVSGRRTDGSALKEQSWVAQDDVRDDYPHGVSGNP
jgi:hypothetical protein